MAKTLTKTKAAPEAAKARGRPVNAAGNPNTNFTVMLPPDLHEWAMQQPERFSRLVQRLLSEERQRVRAERVTRRML